MIKYYKLFDLLNRRNMNKSDLLEVISSKTIAKLSKGANIEIGVIDKICQFLNCQPGDIMECIIEEKVDDKTIMTRIPQLNGKDYVSWHPIDEKPINDYRLGMEYFNQIEKFKDE